MSTTRQVDETRITRRLYGWAFATRAIIGLLAYGLNEYIDEPLLEDALFYEEMGYAVASDWLSGRAGGLALLPPGAEQAWLIVAVIAAFYYLLQGVRAIPVLFVFYSAITAWLPCSLYRVARELGASPVVARRAGWLVALSPAFVFFSGTLYKEGLILVILSVAAHHTLRLQTRWRFSSLGLVLLSVLALFALRFYLAMLLSLVITLGLVWGRRSPRRGRPSLAGVPVFARQATIVVAFVALGAALGFHERAGARLAETPEGVLVQVDISRQELATIAHSGYLVDAEVATPAEAVRFVPIGLLYFLTVPLPWQIGRIRQNMVIAETAFWILLYPLMIVGVRRSLRVNRGGTVFLGALTGCVCMVYALLSGNIGVAYRMRSQVWLLWAPWAAWGWEVVRQRVLGGRA